MEDRTCAGAPSCLPQWEVAYPNGGKDAHGRAKLPTPIGQCMPLRHSTLTPSCCGVPNRAVTSAFRAGSTFGSVFSLTGPPQGTVVVQNASGFRCFRRAQRGGGPKCVSVRRIWPDPGKFGQTQTHFGPGVRKDPGSARDSDAFRTTEQPGIRATVPEDHGHRAAGRLAEATHPPTPWKSRTAPPPRTRKAFPLPSLSRHWR